MQKVIREFVNRVESYVVAVDAINTDYQTTMKKTLYLSLIESLGRVTKPNGRNHERFKDVLDMSEWGDRNKISIPYALHAIHSNKINDMSDTCYSILSNKLNEKYHSIDKDIQLDKLKVKIASLPIQKKVANELLGNLQQYTHRNLLWKMRNKAVHELKSVGPLETEHDLIPYYVTRNTGNTVMAFEIVYPVLFLRVLIQSALINIGKYCEKESIDPFENFNSNDYELMN